MKKILTLGFILYLGTGMTGAADAATTLLECHGSQIRNLRITEADGKLYGEVSWPCSSTDGICDQIVNVQVVASQACCFSGSDIYQGTGFKLSLHTSSIADVGQSSGQLLATDLTRSKNEGRDFAINNSVTCQASR